MRALKPYSLSFFIVMLLTSTFLIMCAQVYAQTSTQESEVQNPEVENLEVENSEVQDSVSDQSDYGFRFDTAWRLVNERYWDSEGISEVWADARTRFEPEALAAEDDEAFFAVLDEMYNEIGDDHSTFVPPSQVTEIRNTYGDLACLGVFSASLTLQSAELSAATQLGNISYELLPESFGYIVLPDLATDFTSSNLRTAVQELQEQGATAFILDMRDNPGGKLTELLLSAGIFTRGFILRNITRWTFPIPLPTVGTVETELPLVVLINGNVNSAGEGLSGALKVAKRAILIGETTAGNVESILPFCFRDGSQAWIATGVLAPIRGATWEGRGVEPDIAVDPETALEVAIEYLLERPSE